MENFTYKVGEYYSDNEACPMNSVLQENVVIASGSHSLELTKEVAALLGAPMADFQTGNFRDGETSIQLHSDLNGKHVVIVQSMSKPVNEAIMELLFLITTSRRNGAESVTVVVPYFAYARMERKVGPYKGITAADVAYFIEQAGANRVITLDTHVATISAMFSPKVATENYSCFPIGAAYLAKKAKLGNPQVVSPDAGAEKLSQEFVKNLRSNGYSD